MMGVGCHRQLSYPCIEHADMMFDLLITSFRSW